MISRFNVVTHFHINNANNSYIEISIPSRKIAPDQEMLWNRLK